MFELGKWHECAQGWEIEICSLPCDIYEIPSWECEDCGFYEQGDDGVLLVEYDAFTDSITPKNYRLLGA